MSGQFKKPFQGPEEPEQPTRPEQGMQRPAQGFAGSPQAFPVDNTRPQGPFQNNPSQQGYMQGGGPGPQASLFPPGSVPFSQPGTPVGPVSGLVPQTPNGPSMPGQWNTPGGPSMPGQWNGAPGPSMPGMPRTPNGPSMPGQWNVPQTPGIPGQPPSNFSAGGRPASPSSAGMPGMGNSRPSWQNASSFNQRGKGPFPGDGPEKKSTRKRRRMPIWARVVIGFLIVLVVLLGSGFWYYEANYGSIVANITGRTVQRAAGEQDPNKDKSGSVLNWGRVNILLLGSDTDQKFQGNYIAQTDIVVSIDTTTSEVDMLSFPRDFYINVPGAGLHKLDEAYGLGGVDMSRRTIQEDFGIPINFYAWVGLDGFIKVIDTVGGVDVDVTHPIVDDNYPDDVGNTSGDIHAYKSIYIPDGPQHLDGATALEYVRSRHSDLNGDFGRSARQQQVLDALKLKLNNPDIIGNLPQIAKDLDGSVLTDMKTDQIFDLMRFAKNIKSDQIHHLTLGGDPYSKSATIDIPGQGATDVVFPQCESIIPKINEFLHMTAARCDIEG